jgi:UV DNA damage repair endonuclease
MSVNSKTFDKMPDFIASIFNVFNLVNKKAEEQKDRRFKMIALTIYNYVRKMAKDNDINLNDITSENFINLIPVFEYISFNNIELYDFTKIDINDVDVTKSSDLERFVLTHVYYITQKT